MKRGMEIYDKLKEFIDSFINRWGVYNPFRDFYYKMRPDNSQRRNFLAQFIS